MLSYLLIHFSSIRCKCVVHPRPDIDEMGIKLSVLFNHNYIFTAILTIHFFMNLITKRRGFVVLDRLGQLPQQSEELTRLSVWHVER